MRERHQVGGRIGFLLFAATVAAGIDSNGQTDVVAAVRTAMASGGLIAGEQTLNDYRSSHGASPEALDALSWLARGALSAGQFERANRYAGEARDRAQALLETATGSGRAHLVAALTSAIDVLAGVLVEQGARSDAIHFLLQESTTYRGTPLDESIRDTIRLLSLEGTAAPPLEPGVALGRRPSAAGARAPAQLLFFWAHWCQDCKAESPMIGRLLQKYESRGLTIVAPTRRYGYVEAGRNAPPDKELRHLAAVRDTFYPFLKRAWVPVTDANHKAYGVAAIPMHVLIDRDGIVRLYRPGRIAEADLDAAIRELLDR